MKKTLLFLGMFAALLTLSARPHGCPPPPCRPWGPPPPPRYYYCHGSSGLADAAAITSIVANGLSIANTLTTRTVVTTTPAPVVVQPQPVVIQPQPVVVQQNPAFVVPTVTQPAVVTQPVIVQQPVTYTTSTIVW